MCQRRPALEGRALRPGAKEGLLGQVLGVLVRGEHPIAVGKQLTAEPLGQKREPAGVVSAGRLDELDLVGADRTRRSVKCLLQSQGGLPYVDGPAREN